MRAELSTVKLTGHKSWNCLESVHFGIKGCRSIMTVSLLYKAAEEKLAGEISDRMKQQHANGHVLLSSSC